MALRVAWQTGRPAARNVRNLLGSARRRIMSLTFANGREPVSAPGLQVVSTRRPHVRRPWSEHGGAVRCDRTSRTEYRGADYLEGGLADCLP